MALTRPRLFTFDVFGTLVDWRAGLERSIGRPLSAGEFDAVIDRQGELERAFAAYADIVAQSLREVLRIDPARARAVAAGLGRWPLFADAREGIQRIRRVAPCVATTNSDAAHGAHVREQLGAMDGWICAEEVRAYKPDRRVWETASETFGVAFGPAWWHVSAYADYDLTTARELGLTTVLVERPHHRGGMHDFAVRDLLDLAARARAL